MRNFGRTNRLLSFDMTQTAQKTKVEGDTQTDGQGKYAKNCAIKPLKLISGYHGNELSNVNMS
jgi:hypothetical protein